MEPLHLRPAEVARDFAQLAELFTLEQDEPTSEADLAQEYETIQERILRVAVAEDERGSLVGFNWITRSPSNPTLANLYVIVRPEQRRRGAGSMLLADLEQVARAAKLNKLHVSVRDDRPDDRSFVEKRGFVEYSHRMGMELDLAAFDDQPYTAIIDQLKQDGFQFTSMEALGNTEQAQEKLYLLNDTTSSQTLGSDGEHPWSSFEDFQKSVCQSDWYRPDGQMVVIDTANGVWAAMSAITRFKGTDYAYNLFTGVDQAYRGRKLAQAVKVIALCYARQVLQVERVRTHHITKNLPMIAIDRKLGYQQIRGIFGMEKTLE